MRGRYLLGRRRSRANGQVDVHQAVHGAACSSEPRRRTPPRAGARRIAAERRGADDHDHAAEVRAERGGRAAASRRGELSRAPGRLRGIPDRRCAGAGRGGRDAHGPDPVVRPRHPLRAGGGARHAQGDPRALDDRRRRDDRRQRHRHPAKRLRRRRGARHRGAEGARKAVRRRPEHEEAARPGHAQAPRRA